jgi:pectin methylesterase-like acyl-CoA thioesterase
MKSFVNRFRIAVPCLFLAVAAGSADAATINVPANFPTIQGAIDAALPGDTIVVAKGVYEEVLNIPNTLTGSDAPRQEGCGLGRAAGRRGLRRRHRRRRELP